MPLLSDLSYDELLKVQAEIERELNKHHLETLEELEDVLSSTYQSVANLAIQTGTFTHPDVTKILDNLSNDGSEDYHDLSSDFEVKPYWAVGILYEYYYRIKLDHNGAFYGRQTKNGQKLAHEFNRLSRILLDKVDMGSMDNSRLTDHRDLLVFRQQVLDLCTEVADTPLKERTVLGKQHDRFVELFKALK